MLTSYTRTQFFACILLSMLFLWSGFTEKLLSWSGSLAYVESRHLPMAGLLLGSALCVELIMPLLLFVRRTSSAAALVLALYCLATALLFHNFWSGDDAAHSQLTNFLKNVSLCGAFLYVFSDLQRRARTSPAARRAREAWPPVAYPVDR
jgi:putative oxidoreductase